MINKFTLVLFSLAVMVMSVGALAQDGDADLQKRIELAQKMHEIKPLNVQVEAAIEQLSKRYPEEKRALFVSKMMQTFDKSTLTEISVNAMAETFTVAELEKMIDFHGSAEGKAITEKMPIYQSIVEPELVKKIDAALMDVRTGSSGK